MIKPKIVYYKDELNDEFSEAQITPIKIDKDYVYFKNTIFYKMSAFFWYRLVAIPIAYTYIKFKFRHKVIGKSKVKKCKEGSFLYGNHTHHLTDVIVPTMISSPKKAYVIVHANNASIPYLKKVITKLGAIPLPDDYSAAKNFQHCLTTRYNEGKTITIYPEAHIWPYCTFIRPFTSASFRYPVTMGTKCFCFTNTYQKRRFSKHPKMVTYVDGPFYPDDSLSKKDAQQKLRDEIFEVMNERAKLSNVVLVNYIKEDLKND